MKKSDKSKIIQFGQDPEISESLAIDCLSEEKYYDAIRHLFDAFYFTGHNSFLEKIAIAYSFIDGAEDESINIINRLFSSSMESNSIKSDIMLFNTLQLKIKGLHNNPNSGYQGDVLKFENLLEGVTKRLEMRMSSAIKDDSFYVVDVEERKISRFKNILLKALADEDEEKYNKIYEEVISDTKINGWSIYATVSSFIFFSFDKLDKVKVLIEEIAKVEESSEYALVTASLLASMNIVVNFDIDIYACRVVEKLKDRITRLSNLSLHLSIDTAPKASSLALKLLIESKDYSLKLIEAVFHLAAQFGDTDTVKSYLNIAEQIYPYAPLTKYYRWLLPKGKKFVSLNVKDRESILNELIRELLAEIDFHEKKLGNNVLTDTNDYEIEIKSTRKSYKPESIIKPSFLNKVEILFYLDSIEGAEKIINKLYNYGNTLNYFHFLVNQFSSSYVSDQMKLVIFKGIQYINESFSTDALVVYNSKFIHNPITTQKIVFDTSNYLAKKELYALVASDLYFNEIKYDRTKLLNVVEKFVESLLNEFTFPKQYSVAVAVIRIAYCEIENVKVDREMIYIKNLGVSYSDIESLVNRLKSIVLSE